MQLKFLYFCSLGKYKYPSSLYLRRFQSNNKNNLKFICELIKRISIGFPIQKALLLSVCAVVFVSSTTAAIFIFVIHLYAEYSVTCSWTLLHNLTIQEYTPKLWKLWIIFFFLHTNSHLHSHLNFLFLFLGFLCAI